MTKYVISNLKASKKLNETMLKEYGFTNRLDNYYYMFKVISYYNYKDCCLAETINITFEKKYNYIELYDISFIYEKGFITVKDYKDYFDGKVDYSMLDDYCKKGVDVAEGILQDLIDKGILEFKRK